MENSAKGKIGISSANQNDDETDHHIEKKPSNEELVSSENLGWVERVRKRMDKKPDPKPLSISHRKNINIQHPGDDEDCNITGCVMIDNDTVALADYTNFSIKIVDIKEGTVISHYKLESQPWTIVYTDKNLVVVPETNKKVLTFLNVYETLTLHKKVEVNGYCCGIDFAHDKCMLIVSFLRPGCVKFMNMDGEELKSISEDANGTSLFTKPIYVKLSPNKKAVYVSDTRHKTITQLDKNGDVLKVYSCEGVAGLYDVTEDKYGNIFIVGNFSHNVCLLNGNGGQLQPILQIEWPQSIVVCDDSEQMIVSQGTFSPFKNEISVYNMYS